MYSIERDFWTSLRGPPLGSHNEDTLGTWGGRIFTTSENMEQNCIGVWEMVDETNHEWVEYARVLFADYERLMVR